MTFATFAPLFGAEFVRLDDAYTIHHNPRLNPPSWRNVAAYWREWRSGADGLYVPLTYTVWSGLAKIAHLDTPAFGGITLNPWVFHAANIIVHAVSVLLVFQILLTLLRVPVAALLGAMLFAVHPVQVETVAWASGMKDLLAGMFSLQAIWMYIQFAQRTEPGHVGPMPRSGNLVFYIGCILAALLAMLSKPSAVMVGPICFVIDFLLLRRPIRQALIAVTPLLLIALPIAAIARHVQDIDLVTPQPIYLRPFIAFDALTFYLGKLIVPIRLAPDYGRRPEVVLSYHITYLAPLVPLFFALVLWRWKQRVAWAAGLIFLLAVLPTLGLATFQYQLFTTVADHYLYLAMLGVALAAAWIISLLPMRGTLIIAGIIIALLAGKSFAQARVWHDDLSLFEHTLAVNPASFYVHTNLGTAYEERAGRAESAGDFAAAAVARDKALRQYVIATEANPRFAPAFAHAAGLSRRMGDRALASRATLQWLHITLSLPPRSRGNYLDEVRALGEDLMATGRYRDAARFLSQYTRARPDDLPAAVMLDEARRRAATMPATTQATTPMNNDQ